MNPADTWGNLDLSVRSQVGTIQGFLSLLILWADRAI
jgi:hypothetical protein